MIWKSRIFLNKMVCYCWMCLIRLSQAFRICQIYEKILKFSIFISLLFLVFDVIIRNKKYAYIFVHNCCFCRGDVIDVSDKVTSKNEARFNKGQSRWSYLLITIISRYTTTCLALFKQFCLLTLDMYWGVIIFTLTEEFTIETRD